jgi:hypothetical protein
MYGFKWTNKPNNISLIILTVIFVDQQNRSLRCVAIAQPLSSVVKQKHNFLENKTELISLQELGNYSIILAAHLIYLKMKLFWEK